MKYEYWFANVKGITNKRKQEIRSKVSDLKELYYIEETQFEKYEIRGKEKDSIQSSIQEWQLDEEYQKLEKKGVRCITMANAAYPSRLRNISSAPYALYVKGKLPSEDKLHVAIVGARECSPYGMAMAREFGKALASRGIEIISGMARGVDSAGQQGALHAGGTSFGVLGCGVDICYPRDAIGLYLELQEQGGVLSEYPPGTSPLSCHFPARNRIISGLSDVVLVIEAKKSSGSLITADMALEQGKDVYALPGPINSHLSQGCNELIKQGAGILLSPEDFLDELGIRGGTQAEKNKQKNFVLETDENMVYSCLDFRPRNLEQLMSQTKLSVSELLDILMRLELKGLVREISKNYYAVVEGNVDGTLSGNRGITCKSKDN